MEYYIYFIIVAIAFNATYLGILYGLYIPAKKSYLQLFCNQINETHSTSILQCNKLLFNKAIDGICYYDMTNNTITEYLTNWRAALIIFGVLAIISLLLLIGSYISYFKFNRTISTRSSISHLINSRLRNTSN